MIGDDSFISHVIIVSLFISVCLICFLGGREMGRKEWSGQRAYASSISAGEMAVECSVPGCHNCPKIHFKGQQ